MYRTQILNIEINALMEWPPRSLCNIPALEKRPHVLPQCLLPNSNQQPYICLFVFGVDRVKFIFSLFPP